MARTDANQKYDYDECIRRLKGAREICAEDMATGGLLAFAGGVEIIRYFCLPSFMFSQTALFFFLVLLVLPLSYTGFSSMELFIFS